MSIMDHNRNCDVGIRDESLSLLIGLSSASLPLQLARTRVAYNGFSAAFSARHPDKLICHWPMASIKGSADKEQRFKCQICLTYPLTIVRIGGGAYRAGRSADFLAFVGRPYLWPAHFLGDVNFFFLYMRHYDW